MFKYNFNSDMEFHQAESLLRKILEKHCTDEVFVIWVKHCDNAGTYTNAEVFVYDRYHEASSKINEYEYSNEAVDVYSVYNNILGYEATHIKTKVFDDMCYSCLAACSPSTFNIGSVARTFIDTNALVYVN